MIKGRPGNKEGNTTHNQVLKYQEKRFPFKIQILWLEHAWHENYYNILQLYRFVANFNVISKKYPPVYTKTVLSVFDLYAAVSIRLSRLPKQQKIGWKIICWLRAKKRCIWMKRMRVVDLMRVCFVYAPEFYQFSKVRLIPLVSILYLCQ